jgi:hypothetical protein
MQMVLDVVLPPRQEGSNRRLMILIFFAGRISKGLSLEAYPGPIHLETVL